jgi:hypothetical protein
MVMYHGNGETTQNYASVSSKATEMGILGRETMIWLERGQDSNCICIGASEDLPKSAGSGFVFHFQPIIDRCQESDVLSVQMEIDLSFECAFAFPFDVG